LKNQLWKKKKGEGGGGNVSVVTERIKCDQQNWDSKRETRGVGGGPGWGTGFSEEGREGGGSGKEGKGGGES